METNWETAVGDLGAKLEEAIEELKIARVSFPKGPKVHDEESLEALSYNGVLTARKRERDYLNAFFDSRPSWQMSELAKVLEKRGCLATDFVQTSSPSRPLEGGDDL